MDANQPPPNKQHVIDAYNKANEAYEQIAERHAAILEAGGKLTQDMLAENTAAMHAVIKAQAAIRDADEE
jgi:hypothetical protein